MKIYLSGAISLGGTKEPTFERFHEAEARLVADGYEVLNPANWQSKKDMSWEWYLARDLKLIYEERPVLLMLTGWETSLGARLELEFSKVLNLIITYEE